MFFSEHIQRKNFKKLDNIDHEYFNSILPKECIETENLDFFNEDWLKKYKGNSTIVLKPKTTDHVSKILKYCNDQKLAVVPQGGNTGLVGGSVPVHDEIIISMIKMNKILGFDQISSTLHCEAGCILQNLEEHVAKDGFTMPIDLGAKGSCFIGGNVATNAGGIHFVKHGSMRKNCKGMKVVLADGTIVDSLNPLPKNNTGYDLKQLFIGSEGTLGIITECLIHTPNLHKYKDLAVLALNSFEDVLKIYKIIQTDLYGSISAIEFFDRQSLEVQRSHNRNLPLEGDYNFYLIVEVASNNENNMSVLEEFSQKIEFEDGIIAQDESQKKKIWELRESIAEGVSKKGIVFSYDISLPLENFYEIVEQTRKRVEGLAFTVGYGHIGDCNLHLNVCYEKFTKDENYDKIEGLLEPFIYDYLVKFNGSISAEHGIGVHKSKYLDRSQSSNNIKLMKVIKDSIDPNGIMNPYKLFV